MLGKRPKGLAESVSLHAEALVESARIGPGTRIGAFTHVMKEAKIGERCELGEHVCVESGATLGNGVTVRNGIQILDRVEIADDVYLGANVVFTNDRRPRAFLKRGHDFLSPTRVGRGATLGAGCAILCGVTIGDYGFVAAGAVVTKNVPPHGLVQGNPARLAGYLCRCAETRFPLEGPGPAACERCATPRP